MSVFGSCTHGNAVFCRNERRRRSYGGGRNDSHRNEYIGWRWSDHLSGDLLSGVLQESRQEWGSVMHFKTLTLTVLFVVLVGVRVSFSDWAFRNAGVDFTTNTLPCYGTWRTMSFTNILPSEATLALLSLSASDSRAGSVFSVRGTGFTGARSGVNLRIVVSNVAHNACIVVPVTNRVCEYLGTTNFSSLEIGVYGYFTNSFSTVTNTVITNSVSTNGGWDMGEHLFSTNALGYTVATNLVDAVNLQTEAVRDCRVLAAWAIGLLVVLIVGLVWPTK